MTLDFQISQHQRKMAQRTLLAVLEDRGQGYAEILEDRGSMNSKDSTRHRFLVLPFNSYENQHPIDSYQIEHNISAAENIKYHVNPHLAPHAQDPPANLPPRLHPLLPLVPAYPHPKPM